jgi:hypothetical protein
VDFQFTLRPEISCHSAIAQVRIACGRGEIQAVITAVAVCSTMKCLLEMKTFTDDGVPVCKRRSVEGKQGGAYPFVSPSEKQRRKSAYT